MALNDCTAKNRQPTRGKLFKCDYDFFRLCYHFAVMPFSDPIKSSLLSEMLQSPVWLILRCLGCCSVLHTLVCHRRYFHLPELFLWKRCFFCCLLWDVCEAKNFCSKLLNFDSTVCSTPYGKKNRQ